MFSISLGFISDNGLMLYPFLDDDSLISSFINGIPSMTYSGSAPPERVFTPRILIEVEAPATPLSFVI